MVHTINFENFAQSRKPVVSGDRESDDRLQISGTIFIGGSLLRCPGTLLAREELL